jgi:hypothetical protein
MATVTRTATTTRFRSDPVPDPVVDLLRALVAGQQRIIALLETRHRPATGLSRADRALLGRLLPVLGGVFGSELFNSADLCEHQAAALTLVLHGLNAKQVGRLLRRAVGTPIGGYLVERVGVEAGAVLWHVVRVPGFSGNEKVSVPHATSRGLVE